MLESEGVDHLCFFFQAEDGIRDAQESRGLGDVYKRQVQHWAEESIAQRAAALCDNLHVRHHTIGGGPPPHLSLIHI